MEEIKENIKVFIRQRPSNRDDSMENATMIGKSNERKDGGTAAISGIQSIAPNGQSCTYLSGVSHASHKFVMDRFFTGDASQHDVFDTVAKPIVESCLKGYSGLVLAYGPTGSGKTYTMRGPQSGELRGIMSRCIEQVLAANNHGIMEIWASYLQIYCEQISDLLRDNLQDVQAIDMTNNLSAIQQFQGDANLNLRMKSDGSGVYVEGLMRYRIASVDDLFDVLERGDQYRSVAATNANEFSSRSHAVLMLSIMIPEETMDPQTGAVFVDERVMREGQLMLVDLAGSERAHASEGKSYLRLEEAKAINLSLSALGNVMNALAENRPHIPYRDSKLTRLLQNCLGGTTRTAIIVNVAPGEDATGETLNALRFANRASKVKVVAKISKHRNFEMLLKEALQKIKELEHFKQHSLLSGNQAEMQEKDALIEQLRLEIQVYKVQIAQLKRENELAKESGAEVSSTNLADGNEARILSRVPSRPNLLNNLLPSTDSTGSKTGSGFPSTMSASTIMPLSNISLGIVAVSGKNSDNLSVASGPPLTQQSTVENVVAVEATSRSMKQMATDTKVKQLTQQVMEAERELKEERERHWRTVQELRVLHDQNLSHESYVNKRIEELLQELAERQNLLDEHKQALQSEREEKAVLEQELQTMKSKLTSMVDKEQVKMMEVLFQETIERMNQRVKNLELQSCQQQQQLFEEQQLHLDEKHQWIQQQQTSTSKSSNSTASYGGGKSAYARSSVNAKTNSSHYAGANIDPGKKVLSAYSFWTPEVNTLRQPQQQPQHQQKENRKELPGSLTSSSSDILIPHDIGQFSNKEHVRIEPGGRLRPNSSNNSHLHLQQQGSVSSSIRTNGGSELTAAGSNSNNLRASLSAPQTLHDSPPPSSSSSLPGASTATTSETTMESLPRSG